jgi:hypothetical protein
MAVLRAAAGSLLLGIDCPGPGCACGARGGSTPSLFIFLSPSSLLHLHLLELVKSISPSDLGAAAAFDLRQLCLRIASDGQEEATPTNILDTGEPFDWNTWNFKKRPINFREGRATNTKSLGVIDPSQNFDLIACAESGKQSRALHLKYTISF